MADFRKSVRAEEGLSSSKARLEAPGEALRDAVHHVRDDRTVRAAHRIRLATLVGRRERDLRAFARDAHKRVDPLRQRAQRALDRDGAVGERHFDASGHHDRILAYSRHVALRQAT